MFAVSTKILFVTGLATFLLAFGNYCLAQGAQASPVQSTVPAQEWQYFDGNVGTQALKLPVPPGFTEPTGEIAGFKTLGEGFTAKSNRLLALYISLPDFRAAAINNRPELSRYFMVQTLRVMEDEKLPLGMFESSKIMLKTQSQELFKMGESEGRARIDEFVQNYGKAGESIKLGEVKSLGVLDEQPHSISIGAVTQVQAQVADRTVNIPIVILTNIVRLKERIVYFYAYSRYTEKSDLDWSLESSKSWIAKAIEMNP